MNNERPLINPTIDDFKSKESTDEKDESIPVLKGQMHFELNDNGMTPLIGATKMKLKRRAVIMEFSTLWRNPSVPFALTSLILTPLILLVGGIIEFDRIPPRIPFYYNALNNHWEQFDKSLVFFFPIVLIIMQGIIMNLAIKIFPYDKKLTISISWILVFVNILLLIAVGQIYTLIT